ncbi:tyrosine-type recombinase/integrase [Vibrio crassostreae]|uniref:tyrosine-type recombinase/integrase n=1 Tax=Vibrio crassostreae TaxID=246167 RepID=UPI001B309FE0|nr:site-specific integrase [Vibrio crassostreae]
MSVFTVSSIKGLKPKEKPYYEWDSNGERGSGKLGVQVTPKGSKRFVFRYFVKNGKTRFIRLGAFPELSLSEARDKAKEYGGWLQQGIDPKARLADEQQTLERERIEHAQKGSIEQLFHSYTAQMKKDGKRTYEAVLRALEKETYDFIDRDTKAKDVTPHNIISILANMIRRGAPTQSNRVRSYLMAAFSYGLKHDNDPANYIEEAKFGLIVNPVSGIPKQKNAEHVGEHYLNHLEIIQLFDDLKNEHARFAMGGTLRNLIALCFYTGGQRPFELISSTWGFVNWEQKTLLIPKDVSKTKREHIVPLTDSAIELLRHQKMITNAMESDYIFPHRDNATEHIRPDSLTQGITRYREATPMVRSFVARDIRRTCKTLMGELGVEKSIRDRLQNHAQNDVSSKHYDRYDYLSEKRRALELWERKLNKTHNETNVVRMRG